MNYLLYSQGKKLKISLYELKLCSPFPIPSSTRQGGGVGAEGTARPAARERRYHRSRLRRRDGDYNNNRVRGGERGRA